MVASLFVSQAILPAGLVHLVAMGRIADHIPMCNRNLFYLLHPETKQPLRTDVGTWTRWLEEANRMVEDTAVGGGVFVSTTFLGIAYSFDRTDRPLLFATIVTGGTMNGHANHYATWDEAVAGHHEIVGIVLLAEAGSTEN